MNNEQNPNAQPGAGDVYSQRYAHQHPDGSDYSTSQYQSEQPTSSPYQQNAASAYQAQPASSASTYGSYQEPAYQEPTAGSAGGAVPPAGAYGGAHAATYSPEPRSSGGKTFLIAFAGALVACVLAIGVCLGFGLFGGKGSASTVNLGATGQSVEASDVEASLAEAVADKCLPSVVSINVMGTAQQSQGNSIYDFLYGNNGNSDSGELSQIGLGSGVILSEDGYIITNNHVISSGQQFEVTIQGESYDAELVGADASSDVAVLKVKDGSGFTPIELGDSDDITIGEWVMSIGCPFGLEQSVATGIVSATSRSQIMDASTDMFGNGNGETTIYPNMIQTDAAINPGNSGGALVDADGQLIGINTLITSYSGNYSGVGFAIPSNYAISLAQSIISGEEPTHAQLGISMTTVNSSIAKRYGFPTDEGAYISSVVAGSAAEQAGLKVGDIITQFDGEKVASASDVMLDVRTKQPGDTVTITVNRDGQTQDFEVTLGQSEAKSSASTQQQKGNALGGNSQGNGNSLF